MPWLTALFALKNTLSPKKLGIIVIVIVLLAAVLYVVALRTKLKSVNAQLERKTQQVVELQLSVQLLEKNAIIKERLLKKYMNRTQKIEASAQAKNSQISEARDVESKKWLSTVIPAPISNILRDNR